ncbi:MAG: triose-phosphate isomerase [Xanthomonadaceae bacterium]|nr:triose-phosphate isomerase [Xanthomonadaceae bacterium]
MRRKIFAGNWKMNYTVKETREFFSAIEGKIPAAKSGCEFQLYVPALSLTIALDLGKKSGITIGAQNVHWETKGAFTGEVSGPMVKEIGVNQVLVGHSERRQHFGETNTTVAKRCSSLLKQGFNVLVCIGETRAEREAGKTNTVLRQQLMALFHEGEHHCGSYLGKSLHVAYEPVWAIGTGLTATPEQAEEAHQEIRTVLTKSVSEEASKATSILYGGSVTPANFAELLKCENIDGGLVGGASLKPQDWLALAQILQS